MLSVQNIVQLIASPRKLNREEIDQLRQLIERFPYSQVFPILYLKSLAFAQDVLLDDEIQRLAIRIQDRQVLFNLIYTKDKQEIKTVELIASNSYTDTEKPLDVTNKYLREIKDEQVVELKVTSTEDIVTLETISSLKVEKDEKLDLTKEKDTTENVKTENYPLNKVVVNKKDNLEEENIFDREALQQQIQLQKAVELQKQQDKERQLLIDKLTTKPKTAFTKIIDDQTNSEDQKIETIIIKTEVEERSFTSWLHSVSTTKIETVSTLNETENSNPIEKDSFVINSAVYLLENEKNITENSLAKVENDLPVKKNVSDLIDKFIKDDPRITSPKKIVEKPATERTEMYNPMKKGKESLNDTQLPVSETLAKIFVVQGNFPKAIFAYQQLMLIFPEKKAFFAKQIKELEQKLNTK